MVRQLGVWGWGGGAGRLRWGCGCPAEQSVGLQSPPGEAHKLTLRNGQVSRSPIALSETRVPGLGKWGEGVSGSGGLLRGWSH